MRYYINIRSKIADVIKKPFLRDVATVSAGSIFAQVIAIASAPILTRLFLPDDFGILAVFISSSAILAVIYTLQFDMAIVLPKDDLEAHRLFRLSARMSLWFLVIFSILASLVFVFPILELAGFEKIPQYLPLLTVLGGFAIAIERSLNYWNIRYKSFQLISVALAVAALLSAGFNITLGLITTGVWILIFGSLLNHFGNILIQMVYGKNREIFKEDLSEVPDKIKSKKLFDDYSDFPKYRMPQSLLNTIGQNIPALLLVSLFNPAAGGFYALAYRMVKMPGMLISEAVRKVFFQKSAELKNQKSGLYKSLLKTTLWLAAIGFVPFILLALASPSIFPFVFGDEWYMAGVYASYLTLWMYAVFCNTPSAAVMPVLRQQRRYLIFNIISLIVRILVIYLGALTGGALEAIIYLSFAGMLYNLVIIVDVHIQAYRDEGLKTSELK